MTNRTEKTQRNHRRTSVQDDLLTVKILIKPSFIHSGSESRQETFSVSNTKVGEHLRADCRTNVMDIQDPPHPTITIGSRNSVVRTRFCRPVRVDVVWGTLVIIYEQLHLQERRRVKEAAGLLSCYSQRR